MSSYAGSDGASFVTRQSWAEAFCALRCLKHLSLTFLAVLRCPWLQRSPLLSPKAQETVVPKHLLLHPGSRASLPRPCFPVSRSPLPPASSRTCCQLRRADPGLLSRLQQCDAATATAGTCWKLPAAGAKGLISEPHCASTSSGPPIYACWDSPGPLWC